MLVNETRVEQALAYLSDTDFKCANSKVDAERWKYLAKRHRAISVLATKEGTAQVKEATAELDEEVKRAEDNYFECLRMYEHVSAQRKTEQLVIEVWRTEQANLRKGS